MAENLDGLINPESHIIQVIQSYYLEKENSDITFVVQNTELPVNRFIVAAESPVFKTLLFSANFKEATQKSITIDAPLQPFKLLLKYTYGNPLNLNKETLETILALLSLAHYYQIEKLQEWVVQYLRSILTEDNALTVLPLAKLLEIERLTSGILTLANKMPQSIFNTAAVTNLSIKDFYFLLQGKTEKSNEVVAFKAIHQWIREHPKSSENERKMLLSSVSLNAMTAIEIIKIVYPTKLYDSKILFDVLNRLYEDIVKPEKGFLVFEGKNPENILLNSGSLFTESEQSRVAVDLGSMQMFNNLTFTLEGEARYSIDVSDDKTTWRKVLDYSAICCSRKQNIYFPLVGARYIKISGSSAFKCNGFKVRYDLEPPVMMKNVICPSSNIATERTAMILPTTLGQQLLSPSKEKLTKCKMTETIQIDFNQPYWIDTVNVRLRIATQSYTLQASTERGVVDVGGEKEVVDGTERIKITPQCIKFFRIVPKQASEGDDFLLAGFEAFCQK